MTGGLGPSPEREEARAQSRGEGDSPAGSSLAGPAIALAFAGAAFASDSSGSNASLRTEHLIPTVDALSKPRVEAELRRLRSSGRAGRGTLPWVGTVEWEVPQDYEADVFEGVRTTLEPWALFQDQLEESRVASSPPAFARLGALPLFPVYAPRESDFSRKLKRLARLKFYREVRHRLKQDWKRTFLDHPSMTYGEYEKRLFQINNVGKSFQDRDDFAVMSTATEVKQGFLGGRRVDGESDIPLLAWGPVILKDTGSLKFDLGRAASHDLQVEALDVGDDSVVPLVATRDYEVETSLDVDVDPFRTSALSDAREAIRHVGLNVEVSWLSDVLGRQLVTAEIDLQTDLYGDFKGFFNLVLKSR